jgi:hypothetical protein
MIGGEALSKLFAEGGIASEVLKFVDINSPLLPGIFAGIKRVHFLELGFGEQCTENMFGVMSRGARGDHLVKGGADQRICLNLSFNGGVEGEVGGGTDGVAVEGGRLRSAAIQVSEFEGVVNVFKVHVFLDDLGKEQVSRGRSSMAPALTAA